jgi:CheY-like chemotaxis protein
MARVLVVDDEDVLLEMIATLIDDLGYESIVATSGLEALQLLSTSDTTPALIISDVMMPKMNGVEFSKAVRENPNLRGVPIILMSAAGKPINSQVADLFLHKPFDLDTLADLIEQFLDQSSTKRDSA